MNVRLRPARSTDAGATGAILAQFQDQATWLPRLYSGAETVAFCGEMIDRGWVRVACEDRRVTGFIARDGEEICALYVAANERRRKVGHSLLQDAKLNCDRLWLRVFQANSLAQTFYKRAGFDEVRRGDGSRNVENLPEFTYAWQKERRI